MRPHSWEMSAVRTERLGNFLKEDFAPRVAASLEELGSETCTFRCGQNRLTITDRNHYPSAPTSPGRRTWRIGGKREQGHDSKHSS